MRLLIKSTLLILLISFLSFGQFKSRNEIKIPDILDYKTLKCDLHTHTVFSDGNVWPTIRIQEAYLEGLDCIAITDHIEYRPYKADFIKNHNRSYEVALSEAAKYGILLIKGTEITRAMPPGHFNAIFTSDNNPIDTSDYKTAFSIAKNQNAFITFNHPFWRSPNFPIINGKPEWFPEHTELFNMGIFKGIEIVNDHDYYPEAFRWAIEHNLTILGNSDIHQPTFMEFDFQKGEHRAMTLVFAKEKSFESIREALDEGRTAVYHNKFLFGKEEFLKPIFQNSIKISKISENGKNRFYQIENKSDISFEIELKSATEGFTFPKKVVIAENSITHFTITSKGKDNSQNIDLKTIYTVTNMLTAPDKALSVELNF